MKILWEGIGVICFVSMLIIVTILKLFFGWFTNISWFLIFSPLLFSAGLAVFIILLFIIFTISEKDKK